MKIVPMEFVSMPARSRPINAVAPQSIRNDVLEVATW